MFVTVASTLGQIQGGQLKLLAYTDANYPADAPKAPTLAEAGVPNMQNAQIFWSVFAPKDVSPEIVAKFNAALNEALVDPSFQALAAKSGASPAPGTPADMQAVLDAEAVQLQSFLDLGIVE
jgi:tripartite-type tricarboxylate transporter receptor subunit TctC